MKAYCGICKKVIYETEANPWKGKHICDPCFAKEPCSKPCPNGDKCGLCPKFEPRIGTNSVFLSENTHGGWT